VQLDQREFRLSRRPAHGEQVGGTLFDHTAMMQRFGLQ
jgi:hypothetical protein